MRDPEAGRLAALRDFAVLDTPAEDRFDRLTALAAALFDAPIALVSLIDEERQWFKSRFGLDATETPRAWAFCDHAIRAGERATFVVEDATKDPRFAANPLVTGELGIRFYAGAVLTSASGHNLGTLCIIDKSPRDRPSAVDLNRLSVLASMVVGEMELARATRAVAEQSRLLRLAEAMSGVGHWRYEVSDGHITWSDEVYAIHGMDRRSFDPNLDRGIAFYHPDDQPIVTNLVQRALAHGEDYSFQLRIIRPDGRLRHVTCKASCERDTEGATTAMVGVFQDVTQQVDILLKVARSEARYRLLTENANDLVTEMDADGRFTYVSPSVEAISGYTIKEVVGQTAILFIHPDDRDRVRTAFETALKGQPGWQIEYRLVRKDGQVAWVEARPTLVRDPATGRVKGVTDVIRDVTERRALQADLERARDEAEAAAAVKSEFLANMSHELRTPLTSILGFSELLQRRMGEDAEAAHYLLRVSDASQALLSTVNDILDFSKLEAGQVEIELRPVDPVAVCEGAAQMVALQAERKGIALRFDSGAGVPALAMMDDTRIRQILVNLVGNAVKFTERGQVSVHLDYDPAAGVLRCEVFDTGPGIPPDRLDRLFRRFSQVDASTTRSHGGSGLGLAICKGLAEAMGGAVGARSTLGHGSCFWFEAPCAPTQGVGPASAAAQTPTSYPALHGMRLLVVDDNAMNRELVRLMMSTMDVEVAEAVDGEAAIALAQTTPYDAILMDIRMAGLSGLDAARAIRQGGGPNDGAPILAFTADAEPGWTQPDWRDVFDGHVAKPVVAADLFDALSAQISAQVDRPAVRTA